MSCVFCALVGFFVANKGWFKANVEDSAKTEIDPDVIKQAEREARELHNMLTYDGSVQEEFKDY